VPTEHELQRTTLGIDAELSFSADTEGWMSIGGVPAVSPGDSAEQRNAEPVLLNALAGRLGIALQPKTYRIPGASRVEVDGVSEDPLVLCEAFAHYGILKSAQRQKLITDAFKLVYVERLLERPARKILVLACQEAAKRLIGKTWVAAAFTLFGVEAHVIELPTELEACIRAAQKRQFR
jgi:hypothetical protein